VPGINEFIVRDPAILTQQVRTQNVQLEWSDSSYMLGNGFDQCPLDATYNTQNLDEYADIIQNALDT